MKTQFEKTENKKERNFLWIHLIWIVVFFCGISILALIELINPNFDWNVPWLFGKKPKPEVVTVQEKVYSSEEFVLHVAHVASSRRINKRTKISLNENESIMEKSAKFAMVEPFKEKWEFTELKPLLKEFPLTVIFLCEDGSHLVVPFYKGGYTEFIRDYKLGNNFEVYPRPKYIVIFDNKIYLTSQSGKLWNRRH